MDESGFYIAVIFDERVVLGRISQMNEKRAADLVQHITRRESDSLEKWQTGTRAELLATFPEVLGGWAFDDADEAYRRNPKHQIEFEREDG
jgi:hypothetical protein